MSRRRLLGRSKLYQEGGISFETLSSENPGQQAFLVQRANDLAEQTFTYSEVINGAYASFISGTTGNILKWYGNGELNGTSSIKLNSTPYIDDTTEDADLRGFHNLNFDGDWIVSLVVKHISNTTNQRISLGIRGTGNFGFALRLISGNIYMSIDQMPLLDTSPTYETVFTMGAVFRLFTFSRINGVFNFKINNLTQTLSTATTATFKYMSSGNIPENAVILGGMWDQTGGGIHQYEHFKAIEGEEATNTDISAYNQSIMTKYGI